jgi:hypothetical protein
MVAVKNGIHHSMIHLKLTQGGGTFVEVVLQGRRVLIGSYYLHPSLHRAQAAAALSQLEVLTLNYDSVIIGGDLNARMDSSKNLIGKEVESFLMYSGYRLLSPPEPTFRSGATLDHFLVKDVSGRLPVLSCETLDRFSDHCGIRLRIGGGSLPFSLLRELPRKVLSYEGVNWEKFNELVDLTMSNAEKWCLDTHAGIDQAIGELSGAVNLGIEKFLRRSVDINRNPYKDLPGDLYLLQRLRERCLRAKQRLAVRVNPRPEAFSLVSERLTVIEKELHRELKKHLSGVFHGKLRNIVPGPHMFGEIDRVAGRKRSSLIRCMKDSRGNSVGTPEEMAGVFRDYYADLFAEVKPPPHVLPTPTINADTTFQVDYYKVSKLISNLNGKRSAGPDGISNYLIKRLSTTFVGRLTRVLRACLHLQYFPTPWKSAKIIPIFKKGESSDPANYRPISLVNCFGKILERLVLENLQSEMQALNLLPVYQTGFRAKHSCLDAAAVFRDMVIHSRARKEHTAVCLLDIRKAFDSVWVDGLCWKLGNFGISRQVCGIITSFLSERTATVSVGKGISSQFSIERGVPQGTVLGPHLYNLFVADQPSPVKGGHLLQYADDTANIGCSKNVKSALRILQEQNDLLEEFYSKWGIAVNGGKSELIVFRHRNSRLDQVKATLDVAGTTIVESEAVKYLGIKFHKSLRPAVALRARLASARAASFRLGSLLSSTYLSTKVKRIMYTMLIRPVATYGSPLWEHASKSNIKKVESFERLILRKVSGLFYDKVRRKSPRNALVYERSGVEPISRHIREIGDRFRKRYRNHSNGFVKGWARTSSAWCRRGDKFTRQLRALL